MAGPKAFIEEVYRSVHERDADRLAGYFAEDCEFIDITQNEPAYGRDALRAYMNETWEGLPDFRPDRWTLTAEGDRVAAELELVGTHTGTMFGHPPTGQVVRWPAAAFYTLNSRHDQILREVYYYDLRALVSQLAGAGRLSGEAGE